MTFARVGGTLNPKFQIMVKYIGPLTVFASGTATATIGIGVKPLAVRVLCLDPAGITLDLYGDGSTVVRLRDDARMSQLPGGPGRSHDLDAYLDQQFRRHQPHGLRSEGDAGRSNGRTQGPRIPGPIRSSPARASALLRLDRVTDGDGDQDKGSSSASSSRRRRRIRTPTGSCSSPQRSGRRSRRVPHSWPCLPVSAAG